MKTALRHIAAALTSISLASVTLASAALLATPTYAAASAASTPAFKVEVSGQGPSMILIPGLASSGEVWQSTVAHYSKHYRCHVLTLAGFAGVPAINGPLLEQTEQQLLQYIEQNKLDKPVLVGHSLGGFVAMKLAAEHGDKVGKLVIVDSLPALAALQMPDMDQQQMAAAAAQTRDRMLNSDPAARAAGRHQAAVGMITKPEDIKKVEAWGEASDGATVGNAVYEMLSQDLRTKISDIHSPTLVLGTWIAYKQYTTRDAVESTFKLQYAKLPGAKIELADNARHFIMLDDPQWMFARMDEFLQ
jgi:pimeloyl-ACP methyl ester carboxylesterase